jgi:Na+-driven multidrug efflux pump
MINMFQSIGKGAISMFISMFRQVVVVLPVAYLIGRIVGINGVWWCYPIAELITISCFIPIEFNTLKKAFEYGDSAKIIETLSK